jgi:predicted RND superfamily exporter protein
VTLARVRLRRWFERLVALQADRPWTVLAIAGVLTAASLVLMTRLELHPGFEYLLPQDRASVKELHRVAKQTAGVSTLFIVLHADGGSQSEARAALRKAGDALVHELEGLGPPWVGSVEDGVQDAYRFLSPRAGLYAKTNDLVSLRDDVQRRIDYEVGKATGNLLDDEAPPEINADTLKKRFGLGSVSGDRFPDGYYESKDSRVLVVAIRSKVLGTDLTNGREALAKIRTVVDDAHLGATSPPIHYGLSGDLYTGVSELTVVNEDLTRVGVTGIVLIGAVVFLYYLRVRALVTMLLTILVGVSWSFAFTELTVGFLNLATGFLFTIIAGNGINAGVIFMARYLEARRDATPLKDAIRLTHEDTWLATLTACVAASASYASLTTTEFRGFRDFGLIGAVGMLLCWVATYWTMPSILVVLERARPIEFTSAAHLERVGPASSRATYWRRFRDAWGRAFGAPFAWIATRFPRTIVFGGSLLALAGAVLLVRYIRTDPIEYDMKNMRNDRTLRPSEIEDKNLSLDITGYVGAEGMAILVDDPSQVPLLRKVLYERRDAAPENKKPFKDIHALDDLVPEDQAAKIPLLLSIKAKVLRAKARGLIKDEDWNQIKDRLPPDDLKPFTAKDLPPDAAQAFTEVDGTRGRIVYISPTDQALTEDAHYLFRWADAFRESRLSDGSVILGSGRAVIYADMWAAVIKAIPPAVIFSFLTTTLVVVVAFRARKAALLVLGSLLVGIGWLGGLFALLHVRLNFLNFIALPITFGIGVDYAVNVVQRHRIEGTGGVLRTVRETGGAVVLCSLTTTLGYLALVSSVNFAVRSLGVAAVLGEVSCLLAAVLVLPAALVWRDDVVIARESVAPDPRRVLKV